MFGWVYLKNKKIVVVVIITNKKINKKIYTNYKYSNNGGGNNLIMDVPHSVIWLGVSDDKEDDGGDEWQ